MRRSHQVRRQPVLLQSVSSLFNVSATAVRTHWQLFALVYLFPFLSAVAQEKFARQSNGIEQVYDASAGIYTTVTPTTVSTLVILSFFGALVVIIASLFNYQLQLDIARGTQPTALSLWQGVKKRGWRLLGLLLTIAGIVIVGLVCLIVPGVIFIRNYLLAPYVLLDQDCSISEALSRSKRMSAPHAGSIWSLLGVGVAIALVGLIPVIGWILAFALTMLFSVAPAYRYFELKNIERMARSPLDIAS